RVVHDQRDTDLVGNGCDLLDVQQVLLGVGDGLTKERLGVGASGCTPALGVVGVVDKRDVDAVLGQRVVEQVVGAAVERRRADDVVASLCEVEDGERFSGLATAHQEGGYATLECRD